MQQNNVTYKNTHLVYMNMHICIHVEMIIHLNVLSKFGTKLTQQEM